MSTTSAPQNPPGVIAFTRWFCVLMFAGFCAGGVAALVNVLLSIMLASTIANPLRRLAAAAVRVRRGVKSREEIPDFSFRQDEIGNLSSAIRDMTNSLYDRIAPYRAYQLRRPDALKVASEEHQRIIDAIIKGDGNEAFRLLVDHVSLNHELFADLLAALNLTERQT